tara:strand:+ start:1586 stop:1795 length:210 start_codon:yes stop_codon:yes gene_type:complete
MSVHVLEIEDSFCQTQETYFVNKEDAEKAKEYLEAKNDEYSYTVYDFGLPEVTTFEQFVKFMDRNNARD